MILNNKTLIIGAGIVAVAAVVYIVAKGGVNGAARSIGAGAVGVVDAAAGGVVQGAGTVLGVPMTDEAKCFAAMEAGDYLEASLCCPAPTFLKFVLNGGNT